MDEMTHRIALQIPDDMLEFLAMIAKREGFETQKTGRAIRWRSVRRRRSTTRMKPCKGRLPSPAARPKPSASRRGKPSTGRSKT